MMVKIAVILFLLGAVLVGCGPAKVSVAGKVTIDGMPVKTGSVAFHPAGSKGNDEQVVGRSNIDAEGNYSLMCNGQAGILAGSYKVVVIAGVPSDPKNQYSVPVSLVDKKFTDLNTTTLVVEVPSSAEQYNLKVTAP